MIGGEADQLIRQPQMQGTNIVLRDVSECLDEACRGLTVVGANLAGLLQDLCAPPQSVCVLEPAVARLENESRGLRRNVEDVLQLSARLQQAAAAGINMADSCSEVEHLRVKVASLQHERDKACAQLVASQGDNAQLKSQLRQQSAFCSSLGSVLGNMVWKASRVPPVVDLILSGNKVADFLCIVSGTLESFLETFNTEMPGPSADESQFIMAMGGIVTNMAAAPAGRQFLVSDPNGRDLIQQITRFLPVIPTPSGNCLKRLLLMALYNVSINQEGLSLLHGDGEGAIFRVATDCLKPESTNELRIMALRLLLSLTCEIVDPNLLSQVPVDMITKLTDSDDLQLKSMAKDVNENVAKAHERIKQLFYKNCGPSSGVFEKTPQSQVESLGADNRQSNQPTAAWRLRSHQ